MEPPVQDRRTFTEGVAVRFPHGTESDTFRIDPACHSSLTGGGGTVPRKLCDLLRLTLAQLPLSRDTQGFPSTQNSCYTGSLGWEHLRTACPHEKEKSWGTLILHREGVFLG